MRNRACNRNEVTQLLPLLRAIPPIRGKRGRTVPATEFIAWLGERQGAVGKVGA
jgi:hypothetical protein